VLFGDDAGARPPPGLLFNFTTNGNGQLMTSGCGHHRRPGALGLLLAGVYASASLAQVVVGRLIDRVPLKRLYLGIVLMQVPLLRWRPHRRRAGGCIALLLGDGLIFGAIPFTDAMIVRYVDDRMRSRVAGMRLAVSFGISSLAVWLLGAAGQGGTPRTPFADVA
jgi:MFS family permease